MAAFGELAKPCARVHNPESGLARARLRGFGSARLGSKWAASASSSRFDPSSRRRALPERSRFAGLSSPCPRQESNLDLPLRRRSSYPLDYEGTRRAGTALASAAPARARLQARGGKRSRQPLRGKLYEACARASAAWRVIGRARRETTRRARESARAARGASSGSRRRTAPTARRVVRRRAAARQPAWPRHARLR